MFFNGRHLNYIDYIHIQYDDSNLILLQNGTVSVIKSLKTSCADTLIGFLSKKYWNLEIVMLYYWACTQNILC